MLGVPRDPRSQKPDRPIRYSPNQQRPTIRVGVIAAEGEPQDDLQQDDGPEIDPDDHDWGSGG